MKDLQINELRKKPSHIGIRISNEERETLEQFCQREQISITNLVRFAIRQVINQKSAK